MKCKKMVSLLLAVVMILGLLPLSAMAAGTNVTSPYVDTEADPNKSYEYTVTGSDGSKQTVKVPALGAEKTGNSVISKDIPGATYYGKVKDLSKLTGEPTLLVYQANGTWYVLNNKGIWDSSLTLKKAPGNKIVSDGMVSYEWTVAKNKQGQLKFTQATGSNFIFTRWVASTPFVVIGNNDTNGRNPWFNVSLNTNGGTKLWNTVKDNNVCLYADGTLGVEKGKASTTFYLYQKMTESAGTQYIVDTTGLNALLAKSFTESQYTTDSWQTYADAKAAAEAAKGKLSNPYTDKTSADATLADIDNATRVLDAAIKGLTKKPVKPVDPGTCVKPEITWHRTWESNTHGEMPYSEVEHIKQGDWQNISWNWNDIRHLTASDPNPWNTNNGTAATWATGGSDWRHSVVRRFTGTFTWPAGVGMDGEMTIQSVNDANYKFIYDHINADSDLKARYGKAKVLPINDDMYVFISKASDGEPTTWTADQAKQHMMFWTGTSGKGIWSQNGNQTDDWSRTQPAQFQGKNATPAYHGSWPNLVDTGKGNNANVQNWTLPGPDSPMTHSDNWYTLTDTNAMKSTLNGLYGATADLAGEEMRIDIYAFNNDGTGGMDKLDLILCAAEQTTAQVQVNYWLDSVGATSLGSTVMTKNIGDMVNLPSGTNTNELNHKKAEAIRIAGASANVSNGTQVEKDFVVKNSDNVINVVYTRKIQGMQYFTYDFGVQNQYIYKDENDSAIKSVRVECATDTIGASFSKHDITLTYTPKDALGSFVQATLVVERKNSTNRYQIGFIPASNVLYEENFINGSWDTKTNHADMTVSDNDDNVYGHTAAYDASTGANGAYTATVSDASKRTSDLKFSFRGLGLDLIGSCGPDYGTLAVKVMQGNSVVKTFIVNTSYAPGVIHQVPLLHTQKGLLAGSQYDVTVRGMYMAPAAVATFSESDSQTITPELYEALIDLGLSDEDMENVEFVNAADNIPADAPMLMSAEPAAAGKQTVSVDSFRVYRSTEKAAVAYAKNEQNLIYTNVMDEAITGDFTAYVEKNSSGVYDVTTYEKAGGPENELYLPAGAGIVFGAEGAEGAKYAQVSLRAVNGATAWNTAENTISHNTEMYYEVKVENGMITIANTGNDLLAIGNLKTDKAVTSIKDNAKAVKAVAAMFAAPVEPEKPEVPAQFQINFVLTDGAVWTDGTSADQSFTLIATDGGLTAPAVQAPQGKKLVGWQAVEIDKLLKDREVLTVQYLQENYDWTGKEPVITFQPVFESEAGAAFEPARFDLSTRVSGLFRKQVALTVKTSTDVASLTVNGKKINATNALLVKLGLADHYTFKAHQTVGKQETASFDVVAFDANGNASVTHTVTK